ncbi:MAG: D-ribose ABC transporter substrate-binding protein [Propionibacteriaceae bacterium]|nr:D-ribose ABC transporter substrate-binding protein [Propionibacteriaceae bacterium]
MFKKLGALIIAGMTALALSACSSASPTASSSGGAASGGAGGGTIAIITVDIANPFWKAEVEAAQSKATELGYETTVDAHQNDPDKQQQYIDGAIAKKVDAILLDPAGAKESVGAVQKATDAGIPVFLINAEITEQGIAKSQIVSNNAQGATIGAEYWVKQMGGKGKYVELFGQPTDNNAHVRSDAYHQVIDQYPDLELVQTETANWDRAQGKQKMEIMLQAHPDITGVISGNDEMALGAISALKDAGKLDKVTVLGFDGSGDAVSAVKDGSLVATVLQPIVDATKLAITQIDSFLKTGETGAATEKQSLDCVLITTENADQFKDFVPVG